MFIYRPGRNVPDLRERVGEGRGSEKEEFYSVGRC